MTNPATVRLKLDPESVAASGRALAGIAQRMADDVTALESTVAGPDNPWGGDESGSVFALAYQGVLGHALQALGTYVREMGEAALTLTAQARAIAATDAFSAASLAAPPASSTAPSIPLAPDALPAPPASRGLPASPAPSAAPPASGGGTP